MNLDNQSILRYPPAAITSSSAAILSSSSYFNNGTYLATASSSSGTSFNCFNYDETGTATEWTSSSLYRSTAPYDYTSTTLTVFNGNSSNLGEWVQLYYDKGFAATRIEIVGKTIGNCPSAFTLVGSTDGNIWNLLSQQSGITTYNTSNIFNINNYTIYNYYRTIFTNTNGSSSVGITEIKYYGVQNSTYLSNDTYNNVIYNTNEKQFPPRLYDSVRSDNYTPLAGNELYGIVPTTLYRKIISLK